MSRPATTFFAGVLLATAVLMAQPSPAQLGAQQSAMHMQMQQQMQMMWMANVRGALKATRERARRIASSQLEHTLVLQTVLAPTKEAWRFTFTSEEGQLGLPDGEQIPLIRKKIFYPYPRAHAVTTYSLELLSLRSGKMVWDYDLKEEEIAMPVFTEDLAIFSTKDHQLVALDRASGKERFRAPFDRQKETPSGGKSLQMFTPVVAENRLYVATHSKASKGAVGKVYAMDTHTGRRLWEQGLQGGAAQEAMLFEDLVLVGGGNWTYAFAAADGKEVWNHFDSERKVSETGFVLGSTVYFICGNEVLALNARSGAKVWAASLKGIEGRSVIIGEGDRIFFIENRFLGRSYAIGLDAKTGLKVWEQKLNMSSTDFSGPCWAQDGVVLLNMGNELLALDLADGKERWRMTTEEKMPSFPTPLGPLVLIATTKKKESTIQALGFIDGKTAWTYKISEKAGAGPVLGAKDCLLFQTKAEAVIGLR